MGSYYGRYLAEAEKEGRMRALTAEPTLPVSTAWDLGMDDSTAIWFFQQAGREIRVLDYMEDTGKGLEFYAREVLNRPYVYADHLLPHDVQVRELGTGKSRLEVLHSLGLARARVVPSQTLADGINSVRSVLPRCWFDEKRCEKGLEALRMYRREYDETRKIYHDRPLHDWTSHAADAFRYLALGINDVIAPERPYTPRTSVFASTRAA